MNQCEKSSLFYNIFPLGNTAHFFFYTYLLTDKKRGDADSGLQHSVTVGLSQCSKTDKIMIGFSKCVYAMCIHTLF